MSQPFTLSPLILGTWQFGDPTNTYKKQTPETEAEIVAACFKNGINCFDTAEAYGNGESEQALAAALKKSGKKREEYVLLSKVSDSHLKPEDLNNSLSASLKRLETDYIDLYQVHWPNHDESIKNTLLTLKKAVDDGKIKAIGVSNFGVKDTKEAAECGIPIFSNQLPYSLLCRSIEYGIVDECKKNNIGILAYSPLAQGILTGKYKTLDDMIKNQGLCRSRYFDKSRSAKSRHGQAGCEKELMEDLNGIRGICEKLDKPMAQVAIAWVLKKEGVLSAVVGASSPSQVESNVNALKIQLDEATMKALDDATEGVKKGLGENPDLWAKESRYR